jgi:Fur family peroxide stress response transcriptional regulator
LNLLAQNGDIIKIEVLGAADRYDAKSMPHFHMICTECNEVFDIPYTVVPENLAQSVLDATGHSITEYDIAFKGICKNCKKKGE